jgi:hypothetical protein
MNISPQEDKTVAPTHTVDLPVIVEEDNVHWRYCASVVINGVPDRTICGECRVSGSWLIESEQKKQRAIDDLRRQILQKLAEVSDK